MKHFSISKNYMNNTSVVLRRSVGEKYLKVFIIIAISGNGLDEKLRHINFIIMWD